MHRASPETASGHARTQYAFHVPGGGHHGVEFRATYFVAVAQAFVRLVHQCAESFVISLAQGVAGMQYAAVFLQHMLDPTARKGRQQRQVARRGVAQGAYAGSALLDDFEGAFAFAAAGIVPGIGQFAPHPRICDDDFERGPCGGRGGGRLGQGDMLAG